MKALKRLAAVAAALALVATPAAARPAAQSADVHPALFVVRDADSTLYLFGTVHIRRPGANWGGPEAVAALQSSDQIWTELIMSANADQQAAVLMQTLGMLPEGQSLSGMLSEAENARFQALTQRLGVPAANFERMRPWLASIVLSIMPMMQAGYDPQAGVDRAIDAIGDASGKQMSAFETMEQQLGFLANLSPEFQRQMLLDTIMESEKGAAQLDGMSEAWERGDLVTLEQLVVTETREHYPELYNVLFVQRNNAWVETLMHELEGSGTDFVAVGAGHLLGEDGLVELLRARGVTVERVPAQ